MKHGRNSVPLKRIIAVLSIVFPAVFAELDGEVIILPSRKTQNQTNPAQKEDIVPRRRNLALHLLSRKRWQAFFFSLSALTYFMNSNRILAPPPQQLELPWGHVGPASDWLAVVVVILWYLVLTINTFWRLREWEIERERLSTKSCYDEKTIRTAPRYDFGFKLVELLSTVEWWRRSSTEEMVGEAITVRYLGDADMVMTN